MPVMAVLKNFYDAFKKRTAMIADERSVNPDLIQQATTILQHHFATALRINSAVFLSEPERRNVVLRLTLESQSSAIPQSAILKQSLPEQTDTDDKDAYARFARDWAGLEFLSRIQSNTHNIPQFYGGDKTHRFILIEDLGEPHVSLVDSLTRPNQEKAIAALSRFMKALGSFQALSFGQTSLHADILRTIDDASETPQDDLEFTLNELLPTLTSSNQMLGLPVTAELTNEAQQVIEAMFNPGPFTVLTHGDICPDNIFDHEEKQELQLIDFEWASVRHALLDGTYLRMHMPTCWCAKAIPDACIAPLENIYRHELKRTLPAASDDAAYTTAYTQACGFRLLQQALPLLASILDNDRVGPSGPVPEGSLWKSDENWVRPRFLSRLQSFIDVASKNEQLPHLRQMAMSMLVVVKKRWPEASPLEVYPAFKGA